MGWRPDPPHKPGAAGKDTLPSHPATCPTCMDRSVQSDPSFPVSGVVVASINSHLLLAGVRENFRYNRSKSWCFQVQPVTCCDLSVFLHLFEVYSVDSGSKMIGHFPEVSNLRRLFLKLNRFICNQRWVLPVHCSSQHWLRQAHQSTYVLIRLTCCFITSALSELTRCGLLTRSIWELHNVNIHYGVIFVVESDSLLSFEVSTPVDTGLTPQHKKTWKEFEEDCISSSIKWE